MPRKKNKWTRIPKKKKGYTFHSPSVEEPAMTPQNDCNAQPVTTHNTHGENFDLKKPAVYTTRLDEMKVVLNPQTVTDHANFFEQIFAESKPKATADSLKHAVSRHRNSDGPMAYVKLKYKIDRININIAHKKMLLEQKQNKKPQKGTPDSKSDNRLTTIIDVTKPKIPKKFTKKDKGKTVECAVKDSRTLIYRRNYIIINNRRTDEADVYYLNNTGMVTQHHRTENGRHSFYRSSPNTALLPYCCWYKRQDTLNSMLPHVPAISVRCMGGAHRCEGRCKCCCKKLIQTSKAKVKTSEESAKINLVSKEATNTGTIDVISEIIVTPVPLNVLIDNMINKSPLMPPISSLIQKAFAFTPPEDTKRRVPIENLNVNEGTQILFSYKDGNEYYKIGPGGVISQHFKNVSQTFIEEHVVSDKNAIIKTVCCWYARQKLINAWRNSKVLTSNYMRTQHTCSLDKCLCCCGPIKLCGNKSNNHLKKLSLPDFPNYTTELCTKLPPLEFAFAKHEPALLDDIIPVDDISPGGNQAVGYTDKTKDPNYDINNPSVSNTVADAVSEKGNNVVDKEEGEKRMLICLNTKLLLEKTLDKLKNVSVQFNRKDKITAVLNIPVTNLSTSELRTLSDILTQAQKDIDALKQTDSGTITGNPNPTATVPTNLNSIINEREKKLQNRLKSTARNHLYSSFSTWSSLHNAERLRCFKLFVNSKIRKFSTKAIKRRNSHSRATIPTKRRNVPKTSQQTKKIIHSKTIKQKTKTNTIGPTNSCKSQTHSKTNKSTLQGIQNPKNNNIRNEPGPSNDPLHITSSDATAKKPFKSKGDPLPVIGKHLNPINNVIAINDSSDEDEGVTDEFPSFPIEIVRTIQENDDDCILGA